MAEPPPPTTVLPHVYVLGHRCARAILQLRAECRGAWRSSELFPSGGRELLSALVNFPLWYKEWWLNLFRNDPVHVVVETTLLACILFFVFSRRRGSGRDRPDKLTAHEEAELLKEWKERGRQPLAPSSSLTLLGGTGGGGVSMGMPRIQEHISTEHAARDGPSNIVVHKSNGRFLTISAEDDDDDDTKEGGAPGQLQQVLNFATFDFLGMAADAILEPAQPGPTTTAAPATSSSSSSSIAVSAEKPEKIKSSNNKKKLRPQTSSSASSSGESLSPPRAAAGGHTATTTAIHPVKQASLDALDRYGCGSCGPRGFYGTIDVHLQLERRLAQFCGTDDAILYSDGASAVSSTIAAFCKRGDLLLVDEAVHEPIRTGAVLSRATVQWFAHNDLQDLRRVLEAVREEDGKLGRRQNAQRRFIVVEGLYKNTGNICPLAELAQLKHEFKCRLILDESFSFGTLGATGRGVTELYQKRLMYDAEIVTVSLENSLGSIGAVTVGTEEVVDHQRLSGSGYCFSASSPPFTATAALAALELIQKRPDATLHRLQDNRAYLYQKLQSLLHDKLEDLLLITSDERSPIILLQVAEIPETEYLDEVVFLQEVVRESLARGVAFVATGVSSAQQPRDTDPPPGIRITVSAAHCKADVDRATDVLGAAVDVVMSRFHDEEEE